MKIRDVLAQERPTLSLEVFPPETEDAYDTVKHAAVKIATLKPDSMSVTYGAGGGTSGYTVGIASDIQKSGATPLAHLTCVSSTRDKAHFVLEELKNHGIKNVLTLRGDIPADGRTPREYHYASELIHEIRQSGDFYIGAARYPEGRMGSVNKSVDMDYLKEKVEAGCDFVIIQMFFGSSIPYSYPYHIREKGIMVPVIAGIMPVTSVKQIKRIIQMLGTYLPFGFLAIVDRFGDNPAAIRQAGTAYVTDQIIDLTTNGVRGIHVYSMNKSNVAMKIRENLSEILQRQEVLVGGKDEYRRH